MAVSELPTRLVQVGAASRSTTEQCINAARYPGAYLTSTSNLAGSASTTLSPRISATTSTSCESLPPMTPPTSVTQDSDDCRSKCSPTHATVFETSTRRQSVAFWLRLITTMAIKLITAQLFLYLVLQDKTLYFLAAASFRLIVGGCGSLLSAHDLQSFAIAAAVRYVLYPLLQEPFVFHSAGVLLCTIFGGYNHFLDPSGLHRSHCLTHERKVVDGYKNISDTKGIPQVQQWQLRTASDQCNVDAKSIVDINELSKTKQYADVTLVESHPIEPEDVRAVLHGMSRLLVLYEDFQSEAALRWMGRLFDGFDAAAKEELPVVMKELTVMLKQQNTTIGKVWTPWFYEGPLWHVCVSKRDAGLQGVVYVPDEQLASGPPSPEDSECRCSQNRSIAGDATDIEWFHFFLTNCLSQDIVQHLEGEARTSMNATRCERTGLNVTIQYLETLWHRFYGTYTSLSEAQALPNDWSSECSLRPYLTGGGLVAINEGVADYNRGNDVPEVCERLLQLRGSPEHQKMEDTNSVLGWVAQIDQHKLLSPHDYYPCACGYQAMNAVLAYGEEQEPGYPTENTCTSLFEPGYLSVDALDDDYDRKEQEDEAEADRSRMPPRCREIAQVCDLHAIPTNNIWVPIDDSAEDPNQLIVPATDNSLPAPGMHHFTSYPQDFRVTQGFLQVSYENLSPRCIHGHLHPPAMEFCLERFPSGRHFDCAECEAHPLLQKAEGRDFTIDEFNEVEGGKFQIDQALMLKAYDAHQENERIKQWEDRTACQNMEHAW